MKMLRQQQMDCTAVMCELPFDVFTDEGIVIQAELTSESMVHILEHHNGHNRLQRSSHKKTVQQSISDLGWYWTGETIIFSDSGQLIDGQHRLLSASSLGLTIPVAISLGVSPDVFEKIPQSKPRRATDVLEANGIKLSLNERSILNRIAYLTESRPENKRLTGTNAMRLWEQYGDCISVVPRKIEILKEMGETTPLFREIAYHSKWRDIRVALALCEYYNVTECAIVFNHLDPKNGSDFGKDLMDIFEWVGMKRKEGQSKSIEVFKLFACAMDCVKDGRILPDPLYNKKDTRGEGRFQLKLLGKSVNHFKEDSTFFKLLPYKKSISVWGS